MPTGLNKKYFHNTGFDQTKLSAQIGVFLQKHVKGHAPNASELSLKIINRLALDARVNDLRYMAYMLATACHESKETRPFPRPAPAKVAVAANAKGKAKPPNTAPMKLWVVFDPINELGKGAGLKYFEPVKVLETSAGAEIVEKDEDQFLVGRDGKMSKGNPNRVGSLAGGAVSPVYVAAQGAELCYFGRGMVQLTWWGNYANASRRLGMELGLLLHPERALEYDISYEIMVRGMIEGNWFTHHKCSEFFSDGMTDYVGARKIINPADKRHHTIVAVYAEAFEQLLMDSRVLTANESQ